MNWYIFGELVYRSKLDTYGPVRDYIDHRRVDRVIKYKDWHDCPFKRLKIYFEYWIVVYKQNDGYDWCEVRPATKLDKALV